MPLRIRALGSGSTGNATLVEADGTRILIDAGLGPRTLAERLLSAGVDPTTLAAVVVSHEHNDHARGAAPFCSKWGVPLYGTRGTYAAAGLGATGLPCYEVLEPGVPRRFGPIELVGMRVPHDAAAPLAFVVRANGAAFGHATDLGHVPASLAEGFRDCDALLLESNYDPVLLREGPYPWSLKERILGPNGHLSNGDVARYLAQELGEACRTLVLAHVSQTNNHPELVLRAAEQALRRRGKTEVKLTISAPEGTDWIEIGPSGTPRRGPRQLRLF